MLRHMAVELGLDMRTDGYVKVRDLLRLKVRSYAEVPFNAHTVDEIREVIAILSHVLLKSEEQGSSLSS